MPWLLMPWNVQGQALCMLHHAATCSSQEITRSQKTKRVWPCVLENEQLITCKSSESQMNLKPGLEVEGEWREMHDALEHQEIPSSEIDDIFFWTWTLDISAVPSKVLVFRRPVPHDGCYGLLWIAIDCYGQSLHADGIKHWAVGVAQQSLGNWGIWGCRELIGFSHRRAMEEDHYTIVHDEVGCICCIMMHRQSSIDINRCQPISIHINPAPTTVKAPPCHWRKGIWSISMTTWPWVALHVPCRTAWLCSATRTHAAGRWVATVLQKVWTLGKHCEFPPDQRRSTSM